MDLAGEKDEEEEEKVTVGVEVVFVVVICFEMKASWQKMKWKQKVQKEK